MLGHSAGCGINEEISQWMERVQNSGVEEEQPLPPTKQKPIKFKKHKKVVSNLNKSKNTVNTVNVEEPINKYSREANENHGRHKRATKREDAKNTCSLYIQTDPLIWKHIREGFPEV